MFCLYIQSIHEEKCRGKFYLGIYSSKNYKLEFQQSSVCLSELFSLGTYEKLEFVNFSLAYHNSTTYIKS